MCQVTRILSRIQAGDPSAADQLLPLVYDELRRLARSKMAREKPSHTLQATALVHDVYLRLVDVEQAQHWDSRGHFFAAAAEAMRRILVENARQKQRIKRGGDRQRVALESELLAATDPDERLIALDEALVRFSEVEPEKAKLVKLRTFAGMSLGEVADVLRISPTTADRWWAYARAWLRIEISGEKLD